MKEEGRPFKNIWLEIRDWALDAYELLGTPFAAFGDTQISITFLFYLILSIFLVWGVSSKIKQILINRIFSRTKLDIAVTQSIGTIVRYFIIVLGIL